jgi:hypothetical protein
MVMTTGYLRSMHQSKVHERMPNNDAKLRFVIDMARIQEALACATDEFVCITHAHLIPPLNPGM